MNIFPLLWLLINFIGMLHAKNFLEFAQPRFLGSEIIQDLSFRLNSCPKIVVGGCVLSFWSCIIDLTIIKQENRCMTQYLQV